VGAVRDPLFGACGVRARYAVAPHFWRSPTLDVEYVAGWIDPQKLERRRNA
jgi:hypothetical protein